MLKKHVAAVAICALCSSLIAIPSPAQASGANRDCVGTSYPLLYDFAQARAAMDKKFGKPNKNKVWQARNESAVWDAWCQMTHSTALMQDGKLITNEQETFPVDGSYARFRTNSTSVGYTIDLKNANGGKKIWKVHVIRK